MKNKLSKGKELLFFLAIILTNVVVMHDFVIYPITNTLYKIFPNQTAGVSVIVSGPAIVMVIVSLLVPYLLKQINKKHLLSIACIIFACASIGGSAISSVPYMIVCRLLCGFAYGIVQVVAMDIIACYFFDENKKASFMGIYNTGMSIIGIIMSLLAGNLALVSWQNTYKAYYLAIPMVILVLLFVPNLKASEAAETIESDSSSKSSMGSCFWIMLMDYLIFAIGYGGALSMLVSLYVFENNLGNEAYVGMLTSINTLGSAIFCILFGFIYSRLKTRTSILHYIILTISIAAMAFIPNKTVLIIVEFLGGAAYGMQFSYMYSQGTSIVPPENISKAISYISAATGLAMFITPHLFTAAMGITGSFTALLPILAVLLIICVVVEFINTSKM